MTAAADTPAPISRLYDLADLSEAGYEARIVPDAKDRARLAEWVEVEAIEKFEGTVELRRQARDRFLYEAQLEADIVQTCVVTLEPVKAHISCAFHRVLHLIPNVHRFADKGGAVTLDAADDDAPEEIERCSRNSCSPSIPIRAARASLSSFPRPSRSSPKVPLPC